ncbi:hypothetical protein ACFL03_02540 [Thermodesulfobacteriota bacterium]
MSITQRLARLWRVGPRLNIKYGFNWASKKTIYGWAPTDIGRIQMPPHHNGDSDRHHHDHETASALSFDEKLIIRLEHWVKHNDDHAKTYNDWAQMAKENDLEEAGVLLDDVAKMTRLITGKFEETLAILKKA